MERLTFEGNFCDIAQCGHVKCPYKDGCSQKQVWERLKAYEDSGLSPNACAEARKIEDAMQYCNYSVERLSEIMLADQEGRLVVLPCKVGDTMWLTASYYTERLLQPMEARVVRIKIDAGDEITYATTKGIVRNKNFGKTVFLTREEAEKALEVMKDG